MSALPRVTEASRERIAREFDDLGPERCVAATTRDLRQNNPELFDMAAKCAADVGDPVAIMIGFAMFYRLLRAQSPAPAQTDEAWPYPLPRVTPATRDLLVEQIDAEGTQAFTMAAIDSLEKDNPELLQMAHNFASRHRDYLGIMQGFALLYRSLVVQSAADRRSLH